jgi:hypothetical protein
MWFIRELWAYIRIRRKLLLVPILLVLALLGVLIVLSESSVIAPFIYTLF